VKIPNPPGIFLPPPSPGRSFILKPPARF